MDEILVLCQRAMAARAEMGILRRIHAAKKDAARSETLAYAEHHVIRLVHGKIVQGQARDHGAGALGRWRKPVAEILAIQELRRNLLSCLGDCRR
ncbi:Uncharacterised protein [Klebsiella oxytoca]|nr:Uncharacterised protein [Klebsiella oxytoca]